MRIVRDSSTNDYGRNSAYLYQFLEPEPRPRQRYWLHILLLLLTLLTTTVAGVGLMSAFAQNRSVTGDDLFVYEQVWANPALLLSGLPFSVTLLVILMAHEMGHFLAARYYGVNATLPFFLPAPTLIGTFGAFIKIRDRIRTKKVMFDVGIAGPLAGFAMLLLPLLTGVSLSKIIPGVASHGDLIFGTPWLLRLFEMAQYPGVPVSDISLHPMARAAWVGLLATALNLLPIGQLDGGHILYTFIGERSKLLSRIFVVLLIPMGIFFARSWLFWAVLLFFFGLRHPVIQDSQPMGKARTWLAILALAILVLSFTIAPVQIPD